MDIISNQESYFALDSVRLNILAKDDRAVNQLVIKYYLGDKLLQTTKLDPPKFAPMSIVQVGDVIELASQKVQNADQEVQVAVTAYDNFGQESLLKPQNPYT